MDNNLQSSIIGIIVLSIITVFIMIMTGMFINYYKNEPLEIKSYKQCGSLCISTGVNKFVFDSDKNYIQECECK